MTELTYFDLIMQAVTATRAKIERITIKKGKKPTKTQYMLLKELKRHGVTLGEATPFQSRGLIVDGIEVGTLFDENMRIVVEDQSVCV